MRKIEEQRAHDAADTDEEEATDAASSDDDDNDVKIIEDSRRSRSEDLRDKKVARVAKMRLLLGGATPGEAKKKEKGGSGNSMVKKRKAVVFDQDKLEEVERVKRRRLLQEREGEGSVLKRPCSVEEQTRALAVLQRYGATVGDLNEQSLFLTDYCFWRVQRALHRATWLIVQPEKKYPPSWVWSDAEAAAEAGEPFRNFDYRAVARDAEIMRQKKELAKKADKALEDPASKSARSLLEDLKLWVLERDLHRDLWDMVFPNREYPTKTMWSKATAIHLDILECKEKNVELDRMVLTKNFEFSGNYTPFIEKMASKMLPQVTEEELLQESLWLHKRPLWIALRKLKHGKHSEPFFIEEEGVVGIGQQEAFDRVAAEAEEEEEEGMGLGEMVDLSPPKANGGSKASDKEFMAFYLGEGYTLANQMISFSTGGQHGSFEAISITREGQQDKKPFSINLPVRTLSALNTAVRGLRSSMDAHSKPPSHNEIRQQLKEQKGGGAFAPPTVDLSSMNTGVNKVGYKLDDLISVKAEQVKWGKSSVDVVTFTRHNKDQKKKSFNLNLPLRLFPALELGVHYIHRQKLGGNVFKAEEGKSDQE